MGAGARETFRRGRSQQKNEQANRLRLAPSLPKHKQEGRANFPAARATRAPRASASLPSRQHEISPVSPLAHAVRPLPFTAVVHDKPLRPSPLVKASISDDGLVLLDLAGGMVLSSNCVGARIWELIEQRRTAAEIATQLASEYGIGQDRARADVATFITALADRQLVAEDARS